MSPLGWIFQGATRPSWQVTVKYEDNSALDITGTTFTGVMRERQTGTTHTMSSAAFSVTSAAGGVLTYTPVASDTTQAGYWDIIIGLEISNEQYYVPEEIEIRTRFLMAKDTAYVRKCADTALIAKQQTIARLQRNADTAIVGVLAGGLVFDNIGAENTFNAMDQTFTNSDLTFDAAAGAALWDFNSLDVTFNQLDVTI